MPTDPIHPVEGFVIVSAAFGDPLITVDCLAKPDSDRGATLKLSDADRIPSHFLLVAMSAGVRSLCKVVERCDGFLRVEFVRG